jgi:hypothetical protein
MRDGTGIYPRQRQRLPQKSLQIGAYQGPQSQSEWLKVPDSSESPFTPR